MLNRDFLPTIDLPRSSCYIRVYKPCSRIQVTGLASHNGSKMSITLRPDWYGNQGWSVSANRNAPIFQGALCFPKPMFSSMFAT